MSTNNSELVAKLSEGMNQPVVVKLLVMASGMYNEISRNDQAYCKLEYSVIAECEDFVIDDNPREHQNIFKSCDDISSSILRCSPNFAKVYSLDSKWRLNNVLMITCDVKIKGETQYIGKDETTAELILKTHVEDGLEITSVSQINSMQLYNVLSSADLMSKFDFLSRCLDQTERRIKMASVRNF